VVKNIRVDPPAETLEHTVPFAKFSRQFPPLRPSAYDPQDSFYKQARIASGLPGTGLLPKTIRFNDFPLRIRSNPSGQGCSPLFATLNQKSGDLGIPNVKKPLVNLPEALGLPPRVPE